MKKQVIKELVDSIDTSQQPTLRQSIVKTINRYAITSDTPFGQVWKSVYDQYEHRTKTRLPNTKKIDAVEKAGHLHMLFTIVKSVCS